MQSNFQNVIDFVEDREKDVQTMLAALNNAKSVEESAILKSTIVLMLYNEIEGAYSNILTTLFDYIADKNIEFQRLHKKIQNIYWEYYIKKINSNTKRLSSFYNNKELTNVDYLEINKFLKLYSGNLDALQIKEISRKLGVILKDDLEGKSLLAIKNKRNCLAHGESGFSEACRGFVEQDIIKMSNETYEYMKMVIEAFDNFVKYQLIVST